MDREDDSGVPGLQCVREEQYAPGERACHEQDHAQLHQAPAIVAIRKRPRSHAKQEHWEPVRNHGVAAQGRRVEFLKHHPIADHVLNAVSHHRHRRSEEINQKTAIAHGGKRARRNIGGGGACGNFSFGAGHNGFGGSARSEAGAGRPDLSRGSKTNKRWITCHAQLHESQSGRRRLRGSSAVRSGGATFLCPSQRR